MLHSDFLHFRAFIISESEEPSPVEGEILRPLDRTLPALVC